MNSYPDNLNKSLFSKSSCQYHCLQIEPAGLDKFVGNASGVRASLEPLILWPESLAFDRTIAMLSQIQTLGESTSGQFKTPCHFCSVVKACMLDKFMALAKV
ncbi:hypothetical protein Q3G72_012406 [Acer saccharum]|nr:hypothetical protein Q3G72_012406 [Acer saccharum]